MRSSGREQVFVKAKGLYCRARSSLGFCGNRRQGTTASTSHRPPFASAVAHIFQPQNCIYLYLPFLFVSTFLRDCSLVVQKLQHPLGDRETLPCTDEGIGP